MAGDVQIQLDDAVLERARRLASRENLSVPAWIGRQVRVAIERAEDLDRARQQALELMKQGFDLGGKPLTRDEAHAR